MTTRPMPTRRIVTLVFLSNVITAALNVAYPGSLIAYVTLAVTTVLNPATVHQAYRERDVWYTVCHQQFGGEVWTTR